MSTAYRLFAITTHSAAHYWSQHKAEYPHHTVRPIGSPTPEEVDFNLSIPFIACPIDGQVYWGFITQADLKRFERSYPRRTCDAHPH